MGVFVQIPFVLTPSIFEIHSRPNILVPIDLVGYAVNPALFFHLSIHSAGDKPAGRLADEGGTRAN